MNLLLRFVRFLSPLIGNPPTRWSHSAIQLTRMKDGTTRLHLDADHLVLDGTRIDVAPSNSPRRKNELSQPTPVFLPRSMPATLSGRSLRRVPMQVQTMKSRRINRDHFQRRRQQAAINKPPELIEVVAEITGWRG